MLMMINICKEFISKVIHSNFSSYSFRSYDEFMAVMKDRLSRGFQVLSKLFCHYQYLLFPFQTSDYTEVSSSKFDQFKRCFRERAKYDNIAALC